MQTEARAHMDMAKMTEWLLGHVNETIMIRKEEDGDIDQVIMDLAKVSYRAERPSADDYVNDGRIMLHGGGKVSVEQGGGAAELPRDSYEISLAGECSGAVQGNELSIRTERATYTVSPIWRQ